MKSNKRVLVLSHNSFSKKQNNGKTLEAFFKEWDKESIAQIYLQPEIPDLDFCDNYFRMTDYELLNNLLSRKDVGKEISSKDDFLQKDTYNPIVAKLYEDRRNGTERKGLNKLIHEAFVSRVPVFISAREVIWRLGNWRNERLEKWIADFSPDLLFFQGSSCVFGYDIALWICEKFDIPLVLELTDDYTQGLYKFSIAEKINKFAYTKKFSKAIKYSKTVIAISEEMACEYKEKFGGKYTVLMNTVERRITRKEPEGVRLIYAGNISLNRWRVLEKIGKALENINRTKSMNCYLDIYTPTDLEKNIYDRLSNIDSINCKGTLNQEELAEEIQNANILVHVESFDNKMKKITRLSISTKIPEYMASKRCILAVGPNDVASIKYLKENNYALVANTDQISVLEDKIASLLEDNTYKNELVDNAYEGYKTKHHPDFVHQTIYEVIENACN